MAPEIFKRNYAGPQVDLFACAVILFFMMTKSPPFSIAQPTDYYYKEFYSNLPRSNVENFWVKHFQHMHNPYDGKSKPMSFFSPTFKSLMNKMLDPIPENRLTIKEIKEHPWYKGLSCSKQEMNNELTEVRILIEHQIKKEKAKKKRVKALTQLYMQKKKNVHPSQSCTELSLSEIGFGVQVNIPYPTPIKYALFCF